MDEIGYNGWKNHATWMVNLHVANDEGTYLWIQELAETAWRDNYGDVDSYRLALASAIREYVGGEDGIDVFGIDAILAGGNLLLSDMVSSVMSDVDWLEIAENWIDDPADVFGLPDGA